MKIIVIHGDDTVKLYERLQRFTEEAKKRNWQITDYSFDEVSNQTLFDDEKFFILRDYKKLTKTDVGNLTKYSGNLIIYHEGKIPALFIKTLNATKIESFDLPQKLWSLLDNITIKGLHDVVKTEAVEMVFALIASRFKDLYWVTFGNPPYPSWRISKLRSQAQKFKKEDLENIVIELAKIDVDAKTGKANLLSSLDILLAKRLSL